MNLLIKMSGKFLGRFDSDRSNAEIIAGLRQKFNVAIVHGASEQISTWEQKFGITTRFVDGIRVTDETNLPIVVAVQAGLLNKKIVAYLVQHNVVAAGLSGVDLGIVSDIHHLPQFGIVGIPVMNDNVSILEMLMENNVVPVFSSICPDGKGGFVNVNADTFTEKLSSVLKPHKIFFISDVEGLIIRGDVIRDIHVESLEEYIATGEITGGMIVKSRAIASLVREARTEVYIGNDLNICKEEISQSTDTGKGTRFYID